ncbi:MAG: hypothetical protein KGI90_15890 [Burkholderiales bacterium]|nr:hypothetical protein [Burkholderiales bacterium]MDE2275909.1 hypothetical protein [Burkholderiales bacterium]
MNATPCEQALAAGLPNASDGPRRARDRPTALLGSRAVAGFDLTWAARARTPRR